MVGGETLECDFFFFFDRRKYRTWCGMRGRWQQKKKDHLFIRQSVAPTPYIKQEKKNNDNHYFIVNITGKAKRVQKNPPVKYLTIYAL